MNLFLFSLQPLASFIATKMRTLASMFGINDDYIQKVSSNIQSSVAQVGFGKVSDHESLWVFGISGYGGSIGGIA